MSGVLFCLVFYSYCCLCCCFYPVWSLYLLVCLRFFVYHLHVDRYTITCEFVSICHVYVRLKAFKVRNTVIICSHTVRTDNHTQITLSPPWAPEGRDRGREAGEKGRRGEEEGGGGRMTLWNEKEQTDVVRHSSQLRIDFSCWWLTLSVTRWKWKSSIVVSVYVLQKWHAAIMVSVWYKWVNTLFNLVLFIITR